ncbi:hypothetical protein [Nostoc sp. TCL240-02]|uniref:hypothetical protein n=1 Tax=Nostoc sp. TCL240-02 TaxID=2572090 RepID=UPI00157F8AE1|nr:hypothetical protein [Nostoc sp. TCL240-02]QKQ76252.1 hypothetical protein FBB35_25835 [Nostoc sp. TCL240-02]
MKSVKVYALITGLSIATVSVPQVKALVSTDFLNQKNQISSNTLQKEAQAKSHLLSSVSNKPSSSNLIAEAVPQNSKLQFVQDTQSDAKPEVIKEQKGKLIIINNTPFIALVQLYQPNASKPNNYANIPPCSARVLYDTYSNKWGVSLNAQEKKTVYDVSFYDKSRNTFGVITSKLNQGPETKWTCDYKPVALGVGEEPYLSQIKKDDEKLAQLVPDLKISANAGDLPADISDILTKMSNTQLDMIMGMTGLRSEYIPQVRDYVEKHPTGNTLDRNVINAAIKEYSNSRKVIDEKQYGEMVEASQIINKNKNNIYSPQLPKPKGTTRVASLTPELATMFNDLPLEKANKASKYVSEVAEGLGKIVKNLHSL